jgi:hypothetical protein
VTGRPLARSQDLIVEELGDEILVYDERTDRGHCLSPEAARVWQRCDGRTPADGLSAQLGLDPDTIDRALSELEECDLLEATPELATNGGTTRRDLAVKMVKVGGAVAAAPMIVSIIAPRASHAATPPPPGCEALFTCLTDCGQTGHGCQGTGCCCCQIDNQPSCAQGGFTCPGQPGKTFTLPSNVKFCAPVQGGTPSVCNNTICPPFKTNPCICLGTGTQITQCPGGTGTTSANRRSDSSTSTTPTTTTTTTTTPTTTTTTPSTPSTGGATTTTP